MPTQFKFTPAGPLKQVGADWPHCTAGLWVFLQLLWPNLVLYRQPTWLVREFLYYQKEKLHLIDISGTTYLPLFVTVVWERALSILTYLHTLQMVLLLCVPKECACYNCLHEVKKKHPSSKQAEQEAAFWTGMSIWDWIFCVIYIWQSMTCYLLWLVALTTLQP